MEHLITSLTYEIKSLHNQRVAQKKQLNHLLTAKNTVEHEIQILDQTRILIEMLKNAKVKVKKDFILQTINLALRDIFGANIHIDIVSTDDDPTMVGKSKNIKIKYDLILYENGIEVARNEKIISSNGGGVLSIISLLMKILTGYLYSDNKFFIFDETLAQVSERFQERLSLFLATFCERYGFTIVLITHNPKLSEHAHVKYEFYNKSKDPSIKELAYSRSTEQDDFLDSDYFYCDIKNFQSIKHASLKFKGFVSITGSNNIGKSAVVRAINSFLFNDFQDYYLRFGEKESRIKFGKHDLNGDIWGEVIYKDKKITYRFSTGDQYTGKRLANDKIREKIAQIGFKYIDTSQAYKSWKSNLKEQAERIYITTQYDGLYLIGAKSTDTDKLFNFLFDAEKIANALVQVNYDLRTKFEELRTVEYDIAKIQKQIIIIDKKIEFKNSQLRIEIIKEYKYACNKYLLLKKIISMIKRFEQKYTRVQKLENVFELKKTVEALNKIDRAKNYFEKFIKKTQSIVSFYKNILHSCEMISLLKTIENRLESINNIQMLNKAIIAKTEQATQRYKYLEFILDLKDNYLNTMMKFETTKRRLRDIAEKIEKLPQQFNLKTCECCGGVGYVERN